MARTVERPNRYFTFLRRLRAEGRSNMYGAIPYLASAFGIDRNEAFRIICEWIDSQAALARDAAVPKIGVPAERAAAPTFFDPVPPAEPAPVSKPRASRKPVKQGARTTAAAAPRKVAPKRPRRPSDSRAA